MRRVALIAVSLLLAAAGIAFLLGIVNVAGPVLDVRETLYDTDADGTADLVRQRIGEQATLWRWDRDGDGNLEVVGYDSMLNAEGNLRATGSVTAWDMGGNGILDEGNVPAELQALLRTPEFVEAAAAGPRDVELVDMTIRDFVTSLSARYDDWRLSGFRMPIVGAGLPDADRLLPGAPRRYRFGIHQGFDMYPGHVGVPTGYGGPVVAAKDGIVVRADADYVEMSPEKYAEVIATSQAARATPPRELDLLRGRQVWIDHGNGVLSRHAHLSSIEASLATGTRVEAGQIIGFVGNSGMEDATRGSRTGAHLHFELRIDDHYFGEGMQAPEIRALASRLFGLPTE